MTRFLPWMLVFFISWGCTQNSVELSVGPDPDHLSIHEAIDSVLQIRSADERTGIGIHILPGTYYLESPIVISPELNGITISGEGVSKVSIRGSKPLDLTWNPSEGSIYKASVPEDFYIDQLIADGNPQILARYPDYNEEGGYWQGHAADAFSKERIASWENPEGTYFHVMHRGRWGGFHYQISGIDEDGAPILDGGHQNNLPSPPHPEYRMVENVKEELDSPGKWYLDQEEHLLFYWPPEGVDVRTAVFEGSILKNLITIQGDMENPVQNVRIQGIKFEHSRRTFMEQYEPLLRSDWTIYRGGAIFLEGTENCAVEECEFTNLGGNVIFASGYNRGTRITGNHIYDCGASAISFVGDVSAVRSPSFQYGQFVDLEDMDTLPGPKNDLYPSLCLVENNLIYRIGRVEKQTAGVQIAMSMDITVRHNSIYDIPRAGINIGDGSWGGHILEYNDVFNSVLETSDHGSFNSWGRDRFWHPHRGVMDSLTKADPNMPLWDAIHTTIIRNNRFRCDHGWDIDLDDGSSNYEIYNNLCLNRGIKLREGFYRVVENNIMVNNGFHPHVWFEESGDIFRRNILQGGHADIRLQGWGKEIDYNLFPDEESLLKAQIFNVDANSSYGDPLFTDPENYDFSVGPASPALELGFVNFAMDEFGVQGPLKSLAKVPDLPDLTLADPSVEGQSPVVLWLRTELKSVESAEEQSAFGLSEAEGVIVLGVGRLSIAGESGLRKGDVIIEAEGSRIKNVRDFLKAHKENNSLDSLRLLVVRNQSEQTLSIRIKE